MDLNKSRKTQDNLHNLLTWFLSPKSKCLGLDGLYATNLLAENISLGYQNLIVNAEKLDEQIIIVKELDEDKYLNRDRNYLLPVVQLKEFAKKELSEYLKEFLIHGSIATLDYAKGWSDLDTYLIVSKETVYNKNRLFELREKLLCASDFLLRIDPLQHHGFLLCTELDLYQYPSFYMPAEVLKYSKSLLGKSEICFDSVDCRQESTERFAYQIELLEKAHEKGVYESHAYHGEYLLSNFRNAENGMYQLKNFIGALALLPSYYLEALGKPCYKKFAFDKIKPLISEKKWGIMDKITQIRSEWPEREPFPYQGNKIPPWVQEIMGHDYFREGYEFFNILGEELGVV